MVLSAVVFIIDYMRYVPVHYAIYLAFSVVSANDFVSFASFPANKRYLVNYRALSIKTSSAISC